MKYTALLSAIAMTVLTACSSAPTTGNQNYGVPVMNRTVPERMIDAGIEHTVMKNLTNVVGLENMNERTARVMVDSFRGETLLTGEVPSEAIKANIEAMVKSIKDVHAVHNYLTVNPIVKSPSHTTHENFLRSKIMTKIALDRVPSSPQYKLVVRSDVAYLVGYLTPNQQGRIVDAISNTLGMQKVVLLATLVTDAGSVLSPDDVISDDKPDLQSINARATPADKPKTAIDIPIVKMHEPPKSSYVQLYNNTSSP